MDTENEQTETPPRFYEKCCVEDLTFKGECDEPSDNQTDAAKQMFADMRVNGWTPDLKLRDTGGWYNFRRPAGYQVDVAALGFQLDELRGAVRYCNEQSTAARDGLARHRSEVEVLEGRVETRLQSLDSDNRQHNREIIALREAKERAEDAAVETESRAERQSAHRLMLGLVHELEEVLQITEVCAAFSDRRRVIVQEIHKLAATPTAGEVVSTRIDMLSAALAAIEQALGITRVIPTVSTIAAIPLRQSDIVTAIQQLAHAAIIEHDLEGADELKDQDPNTDKTIEQFLATRLGPGVEWEIRIKN